MAPWDPPLDPPLNTIMYKLSSCDIQIRPLGLLYTDLFSLEISSVNTTVDLCKLWAKLRNYNMSCI